MRKIPPKSLAEFFFIFLGTNRESDTHRVADIELTMKTIFSFQRIQALRGLIGSALVVGITAMLAVPAQAAFHLWTIREVYTDVSGTLQFIELIDNSGGQNVVGGQQIQVVNVGATQTHTYTLGGGSLSGSTLGRALLFGTAGLQAAGGPAPDYIIPNGFLFSACGTINFFGANSGAYSALPTDGSLSRTWAGGNAVNSPMNYAGQTGTVTVPEPSTAALLVAGAIGVGLISRRRVLQPALVRVNAHE